MVIGHEAAGTGKDTDHAMMCRAVQLTAGRVCQTSAMFRSSTVGCSGEWAGWHTCRTSPSTYALKPPLHLPAAVEAVGQGVTELQPGDRAAIEPGVPRCVHHQFRQGKGQQLRSAGMHTLPPLTAHGHTD